MHPAELADFQATCQTSPARTLLQYLIRMWTVKEAYTKAIGTGLGTEFRELCIQRLPSDFQGMEYGRLIKSSSDIRISTDPHSSLASSTIAAHARVSVYQLTVNPILTSTAEAGWTIDHGHITVSRSSTDDGQLNAGRSSSDNEQRFAWSLASACQAENSPVSIDFSIVDPKELEALGRN